MQVRRYPNSLITGAARENNLAQFLEPVYVILFRPCNDWVDQQFILVAANELSMIVDQRQHEFPGSTNPSA